MEYSRNYLISQQLKISLKSMLFSNSQKNALTHFLHIPSSYAPISGSIFVFHQSVLCFSFLSFSLTCSSLLTLNISSACNPLTRIPRYSTTFACHAKTPPVVVVESRLFGFVVNIKENNINNLNKKRTLYSLKNRGSSSSSNTNYNKF